MIKVRSAGPDAAAAWLRMRHALWPEGSESEHASEIRRYFDRGFHLPWEVLLAEDQGGGPLGFVEVSIRPYAEGCLTHRVAYVEGWFVEPEARRGGVGRALIAAAERWGRDQGCSEFASDASAENEISKVAHLALGFDDVGLQRCFRKDL